MPPSHFSRSRHRTRGTLPPPRSTMRKMIAVVGGGPGGLMTAYHLQQRATTPLSVTIFEASDRLGGKVLTGRFAAAPVRYEIGAAELYDYSQLGPDPLRELVDRFDLPTFPMAGETVVMDGHVLSTDADIRAT